MKKSQKSRQHLLTTFSLTSFILVNPAVNHADDRIDLQMAEEEQRYLAQCINENGILTAIKEIIGKLEDKGSRQECRKISFKDRVYKKLIEPTYAGTQQTDQDFRTLARKVEPRFTSKEILFSDAVNQASSYTSVSNSTPLEQLNTLENYKTINK